jgi:predicted transcriptional regulator
MIDKVRLKDLRSQGKSYNEIARILKCSKSTVYYHLNEDYAEKIKKKVAEDNKTFKGKLRKRINKFSRPSNKNPHSETQYESFTVNDFLEKFSYNPKCYITGKEIDLTDFSSYHLDHIIPLSRGGDCSLENCGVTSPIANQLKHTLLVDELVDLCKLVVKNLS